MPKATWLVAELCQSLESRPASTMLEQDRAWGRVGLADKTQTEVGEGPPSWRAVLMFPFGLFTQRGSLHCLRDRGAMGGGFSNTPCVFSLNPPTAALQGWPCHRAHFTEEETEPCRCPLPSFYVQGSGVLEQWHN